MEVLWSSITIAFVLAVMAVVAYGIFKTFGGGHRPQH
jgi:hypothetical protein